MARTNSPGERRLLRIAGIVLIVVALFDLVTVAVRGGTALLLVGIGLLLCGGMLLLSAHRSDGASAS